MQGWVICRLKQDEQDLSVARPFGASQSVFNEICDLVYGVLSDADFPPQDSWVFLAKGKSTVVLQGLSAENIHTASLARISLERVRIKNDALFHSAENAFIRGFSVSGSPIAEINGTYLEKGSFDGVAKYEHVRKWTIMRCQLPEIEELGISAADTYESMNMTRMEKFFDKADRAFDEIVEKSSTIHEGSSQFKNKFMDIARAGTRLVTADLTLQTLRQNDLRSALRAEQSAALLSALAANALSQESKSNASNLNVSAQLSSLDDSRLFENSESLLDHTTAGLIAQSNDDNWSQSVTSSVAALEAAAAASDEFLETQLVLSKGIHYQETQVPFLERDLVRRGVSQSLHGKKLLDAQSATKAKDLAEAELTTEVITAIEERENAIAALQAVARDMEKLYLDHGVSAAEFLREKAEEAMNKVRLATIDLSEAYGAWARISAKASLYQLKKDCNNKEEEPRGRDRPHAVVIAHYGVGNLIEPSKEMKASVKKFSRGFEGPVKPVELKYVGAYSTRDEAIQAFEEAMRALPEEQLLPADREGANNAFIALRACHKHYLVRSSGVKADIPCEQCEAEKSIAKKIAVEKLYKDHFPPFIYKQENYFEKLWTDIPSCLREFHGFLRVFNGVPLDHNPFLLEAYQLERLRETTKNENHGSGKQKRSKKDVLKEKDPLHELKGQREKLHDALLFSKSCGAQMMKEDKLRKYTNHPFQPHRTVAGFNPTLIANMQETSSSQHTHKRKMSTSSSTGLLGLRLSDSLSQSSLSVGGLSAERLSRALKILTQNRPQSNVNKQPLVAPQDQRSNTMAAFNSPTGTNKAPNMNSNNNNNQTNDISIKSEHHHADIDPFDIPSLLAILSPPPLTAPANQRQSLPVDTDFHDHGATQTLSLSRFAPAFRQDDLFCRTDVGEFASFTKGRAMRTLEFHEQLLVKGKEKEAFRKRLQQMLRKAISVDVVHCNVDGIRALIDIANNTRSSTLALDVKQAEQFIIHHFHAIALAQIVQRVFRGKKARERVKEIRRAIERERVYRQLTREQAFLMSNSLVPPLVDSVREKKHKERLREHFSFSLNLSGCFAFARVFERETSFRKPVSLCISCQTKILSKRENPCVKGETDVQRSFCTCRDVRSPERWLVRFYFPLQQRTISRTFSLQEVRSVVLMLEHAKKELLHAPERVSEKVKGEYLGDLEPMFPHVAESLRERQRCANQQQKRDDEGMNEKSRKYLTSRERMREQERERRTAHVVQRSFSKAWLQSAKESAVLPRLPPSLPERVLSLFASKNGREVEEKTRERARGEMETSLRYFDAEMLDNGEEDDMLSLVPNKSDREKWKKRQDKEQLRWEPLRTLSFTRNSIALLEERVAYAQQRLAVSQQEWEVENARERESFHVLEVALMEKEDMQSHLFNLASELYLVTLRNEEIHAFERALNEEREALEHQMKLDVTRSYDMYEDGAAWKELYKRQKLLKEFNNWWELSERMVNNVREKESLWREREMVVRAAHEKVRANESECVQLSSALTQLQRDITVQLSDVKLTMRMFLNAFSFPKKLFLQGERGLQFVPLDLVFIRDPVERLRLQHRHCLQGIYRRIMCIRSSHKAVRESAVRCVVSVFEDAVTGNVLLALEGDESLAVEEAMQSKDLQVASLHTFSALQQFILKNEIVLTPQEVEIVLRRPVEEEAHREKIHHTTKEECFLDVHSPQETERIKHKVRDHRRTNHREPFVAPSQRPRSLAHITVSQQNKRVYVRKQKDDVNDEEEDRTIVSTYFSRQAEKEHKEREKATELVRRLRIHPYTGRPCLGVLHFLRRKDLALSALHSSLWFSDTLTGNPLYLSNTVYDEIHTFLDKERVRVQVSEHVHRLEVTLTRLRPSLAVSHSSRIQIPAKDILRSLCEYGEPLRVTSFLARFTTGQYSSYLAEHCLAHTLSILPGEGRVAKERTRFWMKDELPAFLFQAHLVDTYRGPYCALHRFVCGVYVKVQLYVRERGRERDWLLEFSRPDDDELFWAHRFRGQRVRVSLAHHELISFIVRTRLIDESDCGARRIMREREELISFLHPLHLDKLFNHVLDRLVFIQGLREPPTELSHHLTHSSVKEKEKAPQYLVLEDLDDALASPREDGELSTESTPRQTQRHIVLQTREIRKHVSLSLSRFNHWITERHPSLSFTLSIPEREIERLADESSDICRMPKWALSSSFSMQREGETPSILIGAGFWGFPNKRVYALFHPSSQNIEGEQNAEESEDAPPPSGNLSFFRVTMHSSLDKQNLSVSLFPSTLASASGEMERLLLQNERVLMRSEDARSHQVEELVKHKQIAEQEFIRRQLIAQQEKKEALPTLQDQSLTLEAKQRFAIQMKQEREYVEAMHRFAVEFAQFIAALLKKTNSSCSSSDDNNNVQIFSFSPSPNSSPLRFRLVFLATSASNERTKDRKKEAFRVDNHAPGVRQEVFGTGRERAFRDSAAWARVNFSLSIPSHFSSHSRSFVGCAGDNERFLVQNRTGRLVRCFIKTERQGESEGEKRRILCVSQCEGVRADGVAHCDLVNMDSLAEISLFAVPIYVREEAKEGEEAKEENTTIELALYSAWDRSSAMVDEQGILRVLLSEKAAFLPHTVIRQHISQAVVTEAKVAMRTHAFHTQMNVKNVCEGGHRHESDDERELDDESAFDIDQSLRKLTQPNGRLSSSFSSLNTLSDIALTKQHRTNRASKKREKGGSKQKGSTQHSHSATKREREFAPISRSESDGEGVNMSVNVRESVKEKAIERQRAKLVFVPFDEALPHKEIDCDFADCQRVICETFLAHFAAVSEVHHLHDHTHAISHNAPIHLEVSTHTHRVALSRTISSSVVLYAPTAQRRTHNVRTQRMASELFPKDSLEGDSASLSLLNCKGDALLLIRHGERDYERVCAVLRRMYSEYLPAMLLRREKAGREREWRRENHQKYKETVLSLADRLLPVVERIFTENHCLDDHVITQNGIDSVVLAQLFRWFDDKYHGTPTGLRQRVQNDIFTGDYHWLDDDVLKESERICADNHHLHDLATPPNAHSHGQKQKHSNSPAQIHTQTPAEMHIQSERDKERARRADMLRCFDAPFPSSFFAIDSLCASMSRFLHVLLRKKGVADHRSTHRQNEALLETFALPCAFSPGQLVYALYQRHCHACILPPSTCPFPGCGEIRLRARVWEFAGEDDEKEGKHNDALPHSGAHGIEREIRSFFSGSRVLSASLRNAFRVDGLQLIEIETADEDIALEKDIDHTELQRYTSAQRLRSNWRQSLNEAQHSELIQELLLSPESRASGLTALEVLRARGGLHQLDRERLLRVLSASLLTHKGKDREKPLSFLKAISQQERTLLQHTEDSHSASRTLSLALRSRSNEKRSAITGSLTVSVLQKILDNKTHGGKIDIYPDFPPSQRVSDSLAMPLSLFHSVLRRLLVCVRRENDNRLVLAEDSTRFLQDSLKAERVLCWDRLLTESVVRLRDGSIVVLTLLAGVSSRREDLVLRGDRGVPDAGLRFAAVCDNAIQCTGWTLVINDRESKISRCAVITERDIERFAEGQQLCKDDWTQLAKRFIQHAARCVSVSRIAGHCTSVVVDLQAANPRVISAPPVTAINATQSKAIRYIGARQVVISRAQIFEEQLARWKKEKGMK